MMIVAYPREESSPSGYPREVPSPTLLSMTLAIYPKTLKLSRGRFPLLREFERLVEKFFGAAPQDPP